MVNPQLLLLLLVTSVGLVVRSKGSNNSRAVLCNKLGGSGPDMFDIDTALFGGISKILVHPGSSMFLAKLDEDFLVVDKHSLVLI